MCACWPALLGLALVKGVHEMADKKRRTMSRSEIPNFVAEMIAAHCDITAVGHEMYVIGDVDAGERAMKDAQRIGEKYGDRDPLKLEIVSYLWSIGRYIELASESTRH